MSNRETIKQRSRVRHEMIKHDASEELPTQAYINKKSTSSHLTIPSWSKKILHCQWQQYTQSGNPAMLFWTAITTLAIIFFVEDPQSPHHSSSSQRMKIIDTSTFNIIFPCQHDHEDCRWKSFPRPELLPKKSHGKRDFGDLDFHPRKTFSDPISIHYADFHDAEHQREKLLDDMQGNDDDKYQPDSSKEDLNTRCRVVTWATYSFPTCNQMHEKVIERAGDEGYDIKYLRWVLCACTAWVLFPTLPG